MKFYIYAYLLLASVVNAQDDHPTGHEVGVGVGVPVGNPTNNVPTVVDNNPSPNDILEGKVRSNSTVSSTPTPTPRVDDNSLKSNAIKNVLNGMYILGMMFVL